MDDIRRLEEEAKEALDKKLHELNVETSKTDEL
jgi:hypothetical protein